MTKEPPHFGADNGYSRYLRDAQFNERVTAANYPTVFALLQRVQAAFEGAEAAVQNAAGNTALARFLFVRSHAAHLAATRLAMSGQPSEAHAVLRVALEQAWYALHIAKDPDAPSRAETWLRRNEDAQSLANCRTEFTVKNVRTTHEGLDPGTAADLKAIYDDLINFGAHPNQLGVLSAAKSSNDEGVDYEIGILYPEELGSEAFTLADTHQGRESARV